MFDSCVYILYNTQTLAFSMFLNYGESVGVYLYPFYSLKFIVVIQRFCSNIVFLVNLCLSMLIQHFKFVRMQLKVTKFIKAARGYPCELHYEGSSIIIYAIKVTSVNRSKSTFRKLVIILHFPLLLLLRPYQMQFDVCSINISNLSR